MLCPSQTRSGSRFRWCSEVYRGAKPFANSQVPPELKKLAVVDTLDERQLKQAGFGLSYCMVLPGMASDVTLTHLLSLLTPFTVLHPFD